MSVSNDAPSSIGPFHLLERIGAGGMGEVWLAERAGAGGVRRRVALKRILREYQNDPVLRERFLAEVRITARLEHPNIAQVIDFGDTPDLFLALEFVEGVSAQELLKTAAQGQIALPPAAAMYLIAEAATGLDYAHRRLDDAGQPLGIVHRDVSPSNILVSSAGAVKVGDFGIARAADNVLRTRAGLAMGKLVYMAPEQALGRPVDRRADVFALGVCLWELLTCRPLIPRGDPRRAIDALARGDFPPPSSAARAPLPPGLDAVVAAALRARVEERIGSAGQLARALRELLATTAPGYAGQDLAEIVRAAAPGQRFSFAAMTSAHAASLPPDAPRTTPEGQLPPGAPATTANVTRAARPAASPVSAPHAMGPATGAAYATHAVGPATGVPYATSAPHATGVPYATNSGQPATRASLAPRPPVSLPPAGPTSFPPAMPPTAQAPFAPHAEPFRATLAPAPAPTRARRWPWLVAAGVVLFAAGGGTVAWLTSSGDGGDPGLAVRDASAPRGSTTQALSFAPPTSAWPATQFPAGTPPGPQGAGPVANTTFVGASTTRTDLNVDGVVRRGQTLPDSGQSVRVVSVDGPLISLMLYADERGQTPCVLRAQLIPGPSFAIAPGQVCTSPPNGPAIRLRTRQGNAWFVANTLGILLESDVQGVVDGRDVQGTMSYAFNGAR